MKFIKTEQFDAFQMHGARFHKRYGWPQWLTDAYRADNYAGVWQNCSDEYVVLTPDGLVLVKEDDWILRDENGDLWGCDNKDFNEKYRLYDWDM